MSTRRTCSGSADRAPSARGVRVEAGDEPGPAEIRRRHGGEHACPRGDHEIAGLDQEQAAEEKGLDVGIGVEDVAREDHAQRERSCQDERGQAVIAAFAAPPEQREGEREHDRGGEGAKRRRKPEAVRDHQARERRGADRVGVEGEPAQHDPGPEKTGADREQQHLEEPALDERELEGLREEFHSAEPTK
jgi:hypothetical protein